MPVRDFNQQEYVLFAGAEAFPCGGCPLVDTSDEDLLFIGHKAGIEVFSNGFCSDGDVASWLYVVEFPTQNGCRVFMTGLPGTVSELKKIGFKPLL